MSDIDQLSIIIHILLCWKRDTSSEFSLSFVSQINVLEPHPFAPILATSGLDHDVKIWAPTSDEPSVLPNLKKVSLSFRFIHPIWCSINSWTNGCWSELISLEYETFLLVLTDCKKEQERARGREPWRPFGSTRHAGRTYDVLHNAADQPRTQKGNYPNTELFLTLTDRSNIIFIYCILFLRRNRNSGGDRFARIESDVVLSHFQIKV